MRKSSSALPKNCARNENMLFRFCVWNCAQRSYVVLFSNNLRARARPKQHFAYFIESARLLRHTHSLASRKFIAIYEYRDIKKKLKAIQQYGFDICSAHNIYDPFCLYLAKEPSWARNSIQSENIHHNNGFCHG